MFVASNLNVVNDISKCNIVLLGAITVVRYYFVRSICMQYPGNPCQKLEVYTNLSVTQDFRAFCRKTVEFMKIRFSNFKKIHSNSVHYVISTDIPHPKHTYW